jgi:hypothetical protein
MSAHVFTPAEVLEAIEAGMKVVTIVEKKQKEGAKVKYYDIIINTKHHKDSAVFAIKDTEITYGARDPSIVAADAANDFASKIEISTTVDKSGEFGRMMEALNPLYMAEIKRHIDAKTIIASKRNIKELIQTHYSEDSKDKTKAGTLRESPLMRFKVDFGLHSSQHPKRFLRDTPKSVVLDFATENVVGGKKVYENAKGSDGEPLNDDNAFEFLTSGSIIKSGRISMESVAISQNWISVPTTASRLVVDSTGAGGYDDDEVVEDADDGKAEAVADAGVEDAEDVDDDADADDADADDADADAFVNDV